MDVRRSTQVPAWVPYFNAVARRLLAAGIPLGPNALITVRGRKTGRLRTTPVTVIEIGRRRWLMGPYGDVGWVRNLRVAGRATISRGRRREEVSAVVLEPAEKVEFFRDHLAPRVRASWLVSWIIRNIDRIDIDDPVAAARGRPVFELRS